MFYVRRPTPLPLLVALAAPALLLASPAAASTERPASPPVHLNESADTSLHTKADHASHPIVRALRAVARSGVELGGVESASYDEEAGVAMVEMEWGTAVHHVADGFTTVASGGVTVDIQDSAPPAPRDIPRITHHHRRAALSGYSIDLAAAGVAALRIQRA